MMEEVQNFDMWYVSNWVYFPDGINNTFFNAPTFKIIGKCCIFKYYLKYYFH